MQEMVFRKLPRPSRSLQIAATDDKWWRHIPVRAGCYAFFGSDGQCEYVGAARCLRCRLYVHARLGRKLAEVRLWYVRPSLEERLIQHLEPRDNRALRWVSHSLEHRGVHG